MTPKSWHTLTALITVCAGFVSAQCNFSMFHSPFSASSSDKLQIGWPHCISYIISSCRLNSICYLNFSRKTFAYNFFRFVINAYILRKLNFIPDNTNSLTKNGWNQIEDKHTRVKLWRKQVCTYLSLLSFSREIKILHESKKLIFFYLAFTPRWYFTLYHSRVHFHTRFKNHFCPFLWCTWIDFFLHVSQIIICRSLFT